MIGQNSRSARDLAASASGPQQVNVQRQIHGAMVSLSLLFSPSGQMEQCLRTSLLTGQRLLGGSLILAASMSLLGRAATYGRAQLCELVSWG